MPDRREAAKGAVADAEPAHLPLGRRGFRGASSRALLLVLVGEFVWAAKRDFVWSGTLVRAMGELGFREVAARKAMQRTAERDLITPEKVGRRVRWGLTEFGSRVLTDGSAHVFGFAGASPSWDGNWLVITVRIPETQRQLRHFVHTRLAWAGLGSPSPGVWLTPRSELATEVAGIVRSTGSTHLVSSYIGRFGPLGSETETVRQAWALHDLNEDYREFIDSFQVDPAATPAEMFRCYVRLLHCWRRFAYLDPRIPERFLPADWAGATAGAAFRTCRQAWRAPAHEHWNHTLAHD